MSRHQSPSGYDPAGKKLYRVDPLLARSDPEFTRVQQWCKDGLYVCGADDCQDPALTVVPSAVRQGRIKVAAYFRHADSARHGDAGGHASPGESVHHLTAKQFLHDLGQAHGHQAEVEVYRSDPSARIARRPDVVWTPADGGAPWAIEVQFSPIPTWQWKRRTDELTALGFRPLWFWGASDRRGGSMERLDGAAQFADRYRAPSDVWVVDVRSPLNTRDPWDVGLAQCHSPDFYWESQPQHGRRAPWPNALDYDRSLPIERCPRRGLRCPDLDNRLSAIATEVARRPGPKPTQPTLADDSDHRDETSPAVMARTIGRQPTRPPVAIEPRPLAPAQIPDLAADQAFTCPRCGAPAVERFYGPCSPCREQLRSVA